ncbi:hypothetical protein CBR_g44521 [Chara braunii]|uniref:WIYLD domain-containing protein n=1 Tax=Chara braunii TaxID=69332 RepID=A0A388LXR8_CHABU|nr:hypothetical protein CBR_g44521 [Chara braunii]|eukprot:GBG87065.1 hypothetical protein CBR_g44521 [Chara braunii]
MARALAAAGYSTEEIEQAFAGYSGNRTRDTLQQGCEEVREQLQEEREDAPAADIPGGSGSLVRFTGLQLRTTTWPVRPCVQGSEEDDPETEPTREEDPHEDDEYREDEDSEEEESDNGEDDNYDDDDEPSPPPWRGSGRRREEVQPTRRRGLSRRRDDVDDPSPHGRRDTRRRGPSVATEAGRGSVSSTRSAGGERRRGSGKGKRGRRF